MRPVNIAVAALWALTAIADIAEFCALWQLKEYRWDRFRDFLSTRQGKRYWLGYHLLWRTLLAMVAFFWPINDPSTVKWLLLAMLLTDAARIAVGIVRRRLRLPVWTAKAIFICIAAFLSEISFLAVARDWTLAFLLIIGRFFLVSTVVFLLRGPTLIATRALSSRARKKRDAARHLVVVGITGSYGKTSVKTFLAHILRGKYRVAETEKHVNTEIGVARTILGVNLLHSDIFLVEMGAYRKGEIAAICRMVQPKIGILTAVNEQHLSLFGSMRAIQETKYELLRSLPRDGLAVTNSDNPYCREFLTKLTAPTVTFGYEEARNPTMRIVSVFAGAENLTASYATKNREGISIETPVRGAHNAVNIASCILVARYLGMSDGQIQERCRTLGPLPQTLQIFRYGEAIIIDDSYNANPDGFKSALQYLGGYPASIKKIVVTRGIPELGERSGDIHEMIGEEMSFAADEVVVISPDFFEDIQRGIREKYRTSIVLLQRPEEILEWLRRQKTESCAILLENRIPAMVYRELTDSQRVRRACQ